MLSRKCRWLKKRYFFGFYLIFPKNGLCLKKMSSHRQFVWSFGSPSENTCDLSKRIVSTTEERCVFSHKQQDVHVKHGLDQLIRYRNDIVENSRVPFSAH